MKQTIWVALLLLLIGTQLYPQAAKPTTAHHREQTDFGAEGDLDHPVAIPDAALQSLRTSRNSDDSIQTCAEDEGIPVGSIPASWFVASEVRLSRSRSSGLVIRGEHLCLGGAHISQFWVLAKSTAGYKIVFRGRADALRVLHTRTNGYRDLQLIIVTQAGAYVDYVNFHYKNGEYQKAGHHVEHPN
jgi:hypothetical protein